MAEWKGRKAVVLFFLGTDCPVSNAYAPALEELSKRFGARGVAFYGVYPDPDVTAEMAAKHAHEYHLTFPVLLDPSQAVAVQVRVDTVPQAVLLSPNGRVLYRGRIDDRYALDGRHRNEPRSHDLADALEAVLAGRTPAVRQTPAFGCPLPPAGPRP